MKKKRQKRFVLCKNKLAKMFLVTRIVTVMLFAFVLGVHSSVLAQQKVNVNFKEVTYEKLFEEIRKQTGMVVMYNSDAFDKSLKVKADFGEIDLSDLLTRVLSVNGFTYRLDDDFIIVVKEEEKKENENVAFVKIRGRVLDLKKEPLLGVSIVIKGTTVGVVTDSLGRFQLPPLKEIKDVVVVFSFVGMETKEIKLSEIKDKEILEGKKDYEITLVESTESLDDVVVTGYANIRKSSFTGTATQVKREDLLKVAPGNIIDALQVFDPSLRLIKNNLMGSDPNTLPEFYIRGRSGMEGVQQLGTSDVSEYALTNNPNTPVFIMDGFEVSVEKVYDFDPNRIASVTILKDAAATAMYGSRASNGVIVIETVAPRPGELQVSYNFTGTLTAPDLSDYNLANAKEKIEVELAAGLLDPLDPIYFENDTYASRVNDYRNKMNAVLLGVDTYWLSQPLQTEFNHKHSLFVEGGVESIRFSLGLRYEGQKGVMKKSYRNKLGGELKIDYRIGGLQLMNLVSLDILKSQNSPYGSFADYTKQQPYNSPYDLETGELVKQFPGTYGSNGTIPNPLYDPLMTKNFDKNDYNEFVDNLTLNWYFLDYFQLKGQFAISYKEEKGKRFIDPDASEYDVFEKPLFEKGELFITEQTTLSWNTNILLTYNNTIDKHNINLALGFNAKEDKMNYSQTHYRGFPNSDLSDKKYAKEIVSLPTLLDNHTRLIGTFLQSNYTYNDIYLFDLSVRFDGSSEFGSNKRFATFWSGGAGINFHNYGFLRGSYISQLRLKANYGQTGKVNYPPYAARHTYEVMMDDWHTTGIGAALYYMGNTDLKWEKANTLNIALDLALKKWLNLEIAWYDKRTKDLISDVTIPLSSGFTSYKENLGEVLNRGIEVNLDLALLSTKDWDVNTFIRVAHNKNEILKISNSLQAYNDQVDDYFSNYLEYMDTPYESQTQYSTPVMKYEEGGSLTSIFGMKSLGIAPANGRELYVNRDGNVTYDWNSSQQVIIGNEEPDLQGSFGVNVRYKGFTLYTTFLFELGGDAYNQTLVDNVENVNLWQRNVDMRVLSMRWQKPGDVAPLKSIKDRYRVTRPTSRFVQENNALTFNSLSLGYDFDTKMISRIGLSMLRLQFNMKDIATFSSIKQERGLDYPFARTFNLSVNISF